MHKPGSVVRRAHRNLLVVSLAGAAAIALIGPTVSKAGQKHQVSVMTRNLDLGASLQPVTQVSSFDQLKDAAGKVINDVDANTFPVRAKGLASEILKKDPDLVGIQEAPLFRDAPCSDPFFPPQASHVRYDYLKLLMKQLNKGRRRYRVAISHTLTDFEAPANTDGSTNHSCDINGRYTDREAILARRGVETSREQAGTFSTLLVARLGGVDIPQLRGWTRVNAKVKGVPRFRFVNTHLEAFDNQPSNHTNRGTDVKNGRVREAQAKELIARDGPATAKKPVFLIGDLNSDVNTPLKPGDGLADRALLKAGWRERSTSDPLSCCLEGNSLAVGDGAHRSQLDHKVDHVMTDSPKQIKLIDSAVTGLQPANGFWDSDHAGVFSALEFR